jgi:hypothetical protein
MIWWGKAHSSRLRQSFGMPLDVRVHNGSVRRLVRDAVIGCVSVLFWPVTLALGVVVLSRRAWQHEQLVTGRNVAWLGRRVAVIVGAFFACVVTAIIALSVASIFVTVPVPF